VATPITDPITVDPEDHFAIFVEQMQAAFPGWLPSDPQADTNVGLGFASITAQVAETAADVDTSIYRYAGAFLHGVPPIEAVAASSTITIAASATVGGTVDAGFTIALTGLDDQLVAFQTTQAVTLAAAGTEAGVPVIAVEAGEAGNDLSGTVERVDSLAFVDTVTLDAATSGGSDAEDDEVYLERLTQELRLQAPRPILPRDFSQLAKRIAAVDSAITLDGYNPSDGTSNNDRMVTVIGRQDDGTALSAGDKTDLDTLLQAMREVNFVVNVADAKYTAVEIHATVTMWDGFLSADVDAAATAALQALTDPSLHGQPTFGEERAWELETKVRLGRAYDALYSVEGVKSVTALTLGLQGGALSAADYTLPVDNAHPVGLPTPGAGIAVTVS
jgi:hypothetical protein